MSSDFKVTGIGDPGSGERFGADDLDKINRILNGENLSLNILIDNEFKIKHNKLVIMDVNSNNKIRIGTSNESADWSITLPVLGGNRTPVFTDLAQVLEGKEINLTDNTLTADDAAAGDLAVHNGTKFDLFPKGTSNKYLKVKSDGSGLEWGDGSSGGTTALAGLTDDTLIDDPQEGDIIIYSDGDSQWQNKPQTELVIDWDQVTDKPESFTPTSHSHTVTQLEGTGGSEGQVIKIVSGVPAWATDATGEGSGISNISEAGDTNFTSLQDGQIMEYDSGSGDWENVGHDHSLEFADIDHDHDSDYASISHDHNSDYAAIDHNHSGVYSPVGHDHDSDYADISHTHAYSAITDKPSTFAPSTHATSHKTGQSDAIKLDELAAPDDNTNLNATTGAHGLLKKLSNNSAQYMDGTGNWSTPEGTGGGGGGATGLADLTDDVDINEPSEGDVLIYSDDDLWENKPQSELDIDWDQITDKPSTFTPSSHNHAWSEITSGVPSTFTPSAHATSHKSTGGDEIKLDELGATTDVTTLNASTSAHGLLKKLDNTATHFLDGQGNWSAIPDASTSTKGIVALNTSGGTDSTKAVVGNDNRLDLYTNIQNSKATIGQFDIIDGAWGTGIWTTWSSLEGNSQGYEFNSAFPYRHYNTGASTGNKAGRICFADLERQQKFKLFFVFALDHSSAANQGAFIGVSSDYEFNTIHATTPLNVMSGVGIGLLPADTDLAIFHNDGSGTATKIPLTGLAKGTGQVTCEIATDGTDFTYNVNDGAYTGTITTDKPDNTTPLYAQWLTITNTNGAKRIRIYQALSRLLTRA